MEHLPKFHRTKVLNIYVIQTILKPAASKIPHGSMISRQTFQCDIEQRACTSSYVQKQLQSSFSYTEWPMFVSVNIYQSIETRQKLELKIGLNYT